MVPKICSIEDCDRPARTRGMCAADYQRWRRAKTAKKPLTHAERFWAKVNKTETCWLWTGGTFKHGYGAVHFGKDQNYRMVSAHRYAYELCHGVTLGDLSVDHLCHTPACVNPAHLRAVTHKENMENRKGPTSSNKASGVRNVHRMGRRWAVQIGHHGKKHHFGTYTTIEEAELVAIEARKKLFTPLTPDTSKDRTPA